MDGTDFYMFNSYEPGAAGYVTLIANYDPLQDAYGGPNYFALNPDALYEINIDNNGDAKEDLTFQFHFHNTYQGLTVDTSDDSAPKRAGAADQHRRAGRNICRRRRSEPERNLHG